MDINSLEIFVEVMRKGSFAAVARDMRVVPSTISRAIANLEDELGIRLLQRTTRRIKPTEAGQVYFQQIEPIVDELDRAKSITVDLGNNPTGQLRLTTSMTFGNQIIVPLLPEFMTAYPRLDVFLNLTDSVLDIVDDGIDVAVRLGKLPDTSLIATRMTEMEYAIVASPEYLQQHGIPKMPSDIRTHQCLVFPMPGYSTDWLFRDRLGQVTAIKPRGRLQLTNAMAHKQCALNHMGITMCSLWSVWQEIRDGSLVQLFTSYEIAMADFDNAVWLVYPSRKYLPLKVRVFIDFMKEKFRPGLPWDK